MKFIKHSLFENHLHYKIEQIKLTALIIFKIQKFFDVICLTFAILRRFTNEL